jgi:hypothetical protein
MKPLTDQTKEEFKGKNLQWSIEGEAVFNQLKISFMMASILWYFDPKLPTVVDTDASEFAISVIPSYVEDGRLKPVAYYSRKMDKVEINYKIHDKEMLTIMSSFKEWRRYLEDAYYTITVFSDCKNLEYFTTTKILNRRQVY